MKSIIIKAMSSLHTEQRGEIVSARRFSLIFMEFSRRFHAREGRQHHVIGKLPRASSLCEKREISHFQQLTARCCIEMDFVEIW